MVNAREQKLAAAEYEGAEVVNDREGAAHADCEREGAEVAAAVCAFLVADLIVLRTLLANPQLRAMRAMQRVANMFRLSVLGLRARAI